MRELNDVLEEFECGWRDRSSHPKLRRFLEENPIDPDLRQTALIELIAIDMEYRWREASSNASQPGLAEDSPSTAGEQDDSNSGPLIEDYARQWPEIMEQTSALMDLIAEEFRIRHRWGDSPAISLYASRFGESPALRRALEAVRLELRFDGSEQDNDDDGHDTDDVNHSGERETLHERVGWPRYRILEKLGSGGMGEVYLAEDRQLGRRVALKMPFAADRDRVQRRFVNEAKAAALLRHPGICQVFDAGEIDGRPFLTMSLIEGPTLREFWKQQDAVAVADTLTLFARIADAMQAAHDAGIVHRDLKPSNVMIDANGVPVVTDFGLAFHERVPQEERITQTGDIFGSPAYMSPEQVEGSVSVVSPASDIYSLGVMLYEAITGRLPFTGRVAAMMVKIARDEPRLPSDLDADVEPELEQLCLQMLAKAPDERPDSMRSVARRLEAIRQGLQNNNHRETGASDPHLVRRNRRTKWLVAACLGSLIPLASMWRLVDFPRESARDAASERKLADSFGQQLPNAASSAATTGFALAFDGLDDHVITPIVYDGSHPITIEAWLSPADRYGNGTIVSNASNSGIYVHQNYEERTKTRSWSVWIGSAGRWVADPAQGSRFEHRRTHVAAVWDQSTIAIYVDGMLQSSGSQSLHEMPQVERPFLIGTKYLKDPESGFSNFWFRGEIDEVRISDSARYLDQFAPEIRFVPDDHTLGLYHFDEASGTIAHDSSGRGNDAEIVGATRVAAATMDHPSPHVSEVEKFVADIHRPVLVRSGPALRCVDPAAHIAAPPIDFNFSEPFTMEVWLTPESSFQSKDWKRIVAQVGSLSLGIQEYHDRYAFQTWVDSRGLNVNSCWPETALYDRRTHVVGQCDGRELQLFINGRRSPGQPSFRRLSSTAANENLALALESATAGRLTLGRRSGGKSVIGGLIDRFRLSRGMRYARDFEPADFGVDEQTIVLYDFHEGEGDILHDISGNGYHADILGATWVDGPSIKVNPRPRG